MTTLFESEYITRAWPSLVRSFGVLCSYYSETDGVVDTGYPKSIYFVPEITRAKDHGEGVRGGRDGAMRVDTKEVKISQGDIAQPEIGNYLSISGENWTVSHIYYNAGGIWTLGLTKVDDYRKGQKRIQR